jgi:transposase
VLSFVEQLDQRVLDAEARVDHSQQRLIDLLTKELVRAQATIARKSQQLIHERQLNHQLRKRIRELERDLERADQQSVPRDSHNSSLPPSLDLPWKKVLRTRSLREKTGLRAGGQPHHPGRTLRQVERPDEIITHAPFNCQGCKSSLNQLRPTGCVRRQVFDIEEGRMKVTEHQALIICCRKCETRTKAAFPREVCAPVQYGVGVLSRVSYLHLYQLLPIARTSEAMQDLFGCSISVATVQRASRIFSGKLVRTEQRIKTAIRDASVIGADETGLRVAGNNSWIHVARTNHFTHYAYDGRRGKAAMDEIGILPQFKGTLVRDGYLSYSRFGKCRHSLCNAHLLRELVFIEETDPEQRFWIRALAKLLLKIKATADLTRTQKEETIDKVKQRGWVRRYEQLVKKAARLNPPLPRRKRVSGAPKKKRITQPTASNLAERLQRRRDEVLRFMIDLSVPFDNNGSERDLRMIKLQQKISGCFRTQDGARHFCRVRSYLSTARKQGHSLLYALERALAGKPLPFSTAENASTT